MWAEFWMKKAADHQMFWSITSQYEQNSGPNPANSVSRNHETADFAAKTFLLPDNLLTLEVILQDLDAFLGKGL